MNLLVYFFLNLCSTDIESLAKEITLNEPLLSDEVLPELTNSLGKLQKKLFEPVKSKFYHFKTLKTNILPLTNVAFNKNGDR